MKTATDPSVSFTVKGQVVIPVQVRRMFGIEGGTRAVVKATRNGILLQPITKAVIDAGCGILPRAKAGAIAEERALYKVEERELEERRARRRS